MRVWVLGASGFVGQAAVAALLQAGHTVVAVARRPPEARPGLVPVAVDLVDGPAVQRSLGQAAPADAALHLVHSLGDTGFAAREEATAQNVAAACRTAGVGRLVYLGGMMPLLPAGQAPSVHLQARARTGAILQGAAPSVLELRAGIVLGPGGATFRFLRDLAARCPLTVATPFLAVRQAPIALDDVVAALLAMLLRPDVTGSFDLPGPEVVSTRALLEECRALLGLRGAHVPLPVPRAALLWAGTRLSRADRSVLLHILGDAPAVDHLPACATDDLYTHHPELPRTPLRQALLAGLAAEEASVDGGGAVVEQLLWRLLRRPRWILG